jgi:predicted dehydrogenase
MNHLILLTLFCSLSAYTYSQSNKPFRIGIDGLTHDHVHWLLGRADDGDLEIVGIAEPNHALAEKYVKQYNLSPSIIYPSLKSMLEKVTPDAVAAFNSIYEHLETVKQCAPRKIHVMVEKPLAVSMAHAVEMKTLAQQHGIHLLTNYETTWYGSNHKTYEMLQHLGDLRKVVVHDGHEGPSEIGVSKEFLSWLTDPKMNGGGALTDFGCYGANLLTWLMNGQRPTSVLAVTQTMKPNLYPKVDDEATIVLTYPHAQGIIQASWNWPFGRKDMEVYGTKGYIIADRSGMKQKLDPKSVEQLIKAPDLPKPYHDPFSYFAAVVRKEIQVKPTDLSSLDNNLIVVEILEAAKRSAKEGKAITFK